MAVQVQIDASKVQSQMDVFINAVKASNSVVGEFTVKALQFNEAGKLIGGTLEQMAAGGAKVSASFDIMANTATLAGAKVTTSARDMAAQLERLQTLAGKSAGDQARNLFPLPPDASISRITSYNNQITNLQRAVGAAGLSASQITALFNQAANAPAQFAQRIQNLPPQLQAVGQAMLAVAAQAQQAGQQGAAAGQSFAISWQGLVRIFEAQVFRRTISALIDGIRQGVTASLDYQIQLAQVSNVTQQTGDRTAAFAARVRALSNEFAVPIGEVLSASQIALTGQLNDTAAGFNVLTNAMRLSQATGTDLAASTRLITSSLQAFRLSGDDAARVTNVLYNAAQRSRVPLEEMQAAIGRVSQTASGLGVTFEQTTALFLTIAQQGGRPTEAFSLLNQVMGRLLQPTKELQDFLQGMGFASAQAGIQTLGLTGFLGRLSEAASRSPGALGDLAGSVRTLRGLMAITGDQTRIFEDNLQSLGRTNVLDGAANVAQTNAQRIRQAFNELKNVFTVDVGQSLIGSLVGISDALGGAKATAAAFTEVIKGLLIGFAAFKITLGIGTLIESYTVATRGAAAATATLGTTMTTTAASVNIFAAAFALAFAAGNLYFANERANEAALEEAIRRRIRALNEVTERQQEANRAANTRQQELGRNFVQEAFRPELEASAQRLQLYQQQREAAIEVHKASQDAFHAANQAILDGMREQLSQTRRNREEARAGIEQSIRSQESFAQGVNAAGFQRTLSLNTDPARGIQLLQDRRRQNQEEIEAIQRNRNATADQIAHARQLFEENRRITAEIDQRDVALQRIRNAQTQNYTIEVRNGVRVRVERIDETAALERQNRLIQERNRFEEQVRITLRRQQEEQRILQVGQQLQLRTLEAAIRRSEQFNPFGADGNLAERYTRGGRSQQQAQQAALNDAAARRDQVLAEARRTLGADYNRQGTEAYRIYQELQRTEQQRLITLREEIIAAGRVSREMQSQQRTQEQIRQDTELLNRQVAERGRLERQIIGDAGAAGNSVTRAQGSLTALPQIGNAVRAVSTDAQIAEAQRIRAEYEQMRTALGAVATAQRNLTQAQTPENVRAYAEAVEELRRRQQTLLATINNPENNGAINRAGISDRQRDAIRTLGTSQIPTLQAIANGINRTLQDLTTANQNIENITRGQTGAAGNIAAQLQQGVTTVIQQGPAFGQVFATAQQNVAGPNGLNAALGRTAELIRTMPAIPAAPGAAAQAPGSWMGGFVGYRASGGMTGSHPGGPRGTDTLPYWLSPGEFVVNAHSTGKFYSQLLAINSGHQPKYAAGGGPVTVGDINVNVNGGQPTERTIRDIGIGINREIRRGTIRWRV